MLQNSFPLSVVLTSLRSFASKV